MIDKHTFITYLARYEVKREKISAIIRETFDFISIGNNSTSSKTAIRKLVIRRR